MSESIYGSYLPELERVMRELQESIDKLREEIREETGMDPVEHCLARIKSEESMREKCRRKMLPEDTEVALTQIYDAVGLRVVCAFIDDIYRIRDHLVQQPGTEVVEEKDYIRNVKPN